VALVPLLMVLGLLVLLGAATTVRRRTRLSSELVVAAARAHARRFAVAAPILALVAAVATAAGGALGQPHGRTAGVAVVLVSIIFGGVHTGVLLLGELTWPRPVGAVRRARLVHRGLRDVAPRWLLRAAVAALLLAGVVLGGGAALAQPDGRSVGHAVPTPDGMGYRVASPFPGWFYGGPTAAGLAVLVVLAGAALWVVIIRPAVATSDEPAEVALRQASAYRVLRGAVGSTLIVTGGLLGVGGLSLAAVLSSPPPQLLAMAPGALVLLAGVVLVGRRAPSVPSHELVAA
jgi:hypothetical protein